MNLRLCGLALFLGQMVLAGDLTLSQQELDDPQRKSTFFDPHNHSGGVRSPLALINQSEYVMGKAPSLFELKGFWDGIVKYYHTDPNFRFDQRISNGTKMLINCNESSRICSMGTNDDFACRKKLITGIDEILTANVLTSFTGAYSMRSRLDDIGKVFSHVKDRSSTLVKDQAFLLALAQADTDLVEMSKAFMQGKNDEKDTSDIRRFSKLYDDLVGDHTSLENMAFKEHLQSLGLTIPRIKWLLMTHTKQLGEISPTKTLDYSKGFCQEVEMPAVLVNNPKDGIFGVLTNYRDVVGVDVAGAETTCFTNYGMGQFKVLARTTYEAARIRQNEKNIPGKLVVRVHVGEGFPLMAPEKFTESRTASCEETTKYPKLQYMHDRNQLLPIHVVESRKNIGYILDAIADLKGEHPEIGSFIEFRLGHATHLDRDLAITAKGLGVAIDINLSSNVATGAWTVPQHVVDRYLVARGVTPKDIPSLLHTLRQQGAPLGEIFEGHGLKWALLYGIEVTMGTDGAGLENSDGLRGEYLMAEDLVKYWNEHDPEFASKNIGITEVLLNQKKHYEVMEYNSLPKIVGPDLHTDDKNQTNEK